MNRTEKVIAFLQENGCGTTRELAEAMGCNVRMGTLTLCELQRRGVVQTSARDVRAAGKSGGRPMNTWGLTREKLEELVSAPTATIGERVLDWLMAGNVGPATQAATAVGVSSQSAAEAFTRLGKAGLAKVVGKTRPQGGHGASAFVWAWTGSGEAVPLRRRTPPKMVQEEEVEDDLRPLNPTPPEVIVRLAMERRPLLELVWGQA